MRVVMGASVSILLLAGLAGCVAQQPTPGPTDAQSSAPAPSGSPSPSSSPTPQPTGAAAEQERFDAAMADVLATNADPDGRTVIDTLVAAGFDKAAMELTPDTTAIGLDADSIQFSVRIGEECIVGQSGNVGYHSAVLPVLSTNTCLAGKTRAINW